MLEIEHRTLRISMTVSTLSAQEGDTAVTHPSTGLFSRKTLPIALQTRDLGVFLAETLPDRRTQGLCARTFAQNVLEKRVTMPHRARFRLKRARTRSRGAEGQQRKQRKQGRQIFPCPFTERNFYYICIITRLRADAPACQSTDGRVQTAK